MPRGWEAARSAAVATDRIVEWLRSLPAELARRGVVLVPAERVAHGLRRRVCVELGEPGLLAGVRLLPPVAFAREVLARAGIATAPGGEALRRLRILAVLQAGGLELQYFRAEQLRAGRGYTDAFSRAIADLERSGLSASDAERVAEGLIDSDRLAARRLRDLAVVWRAAEGADPVPSTDGQILQAAARLLGARPERGLVLGPVAALIAGEPSAALLHVLTALRTAAVVFIDALPWRADTQRWRPALLPAVANRPPAADLGPLFARLQVAPVLPWQDDRDAAAPATELRLLQRYLFAPPEVLSDPARPRSSGPDGSVELEEYSSLEEEVEAAGAWVAEQVCDGIAIEDIALIVPEVEPYARALIDRLQRVGAPAAWAAAPATGIEVYVAGGLALADTPAGVRLLALLRAWRRGLDAESVIRVLPALRVESDDAGAPRLTPSAAAELVYGAGIVGGSPGDPSGAREWLPRLRRRAASLAAVVAEPDVGTVDEPEKQPHQWAREQARAALDTLERLLPGVEALQAVGELMVDGAPLSALWPAACDFIRTWYRLPPDPPNLLAVLDERIAAVLGDAAAAQVCGGMAVDWLVELVRRERTATSRYGGGRVFVGTPAAAAGLSFRAVRVLGLAEGAVPRTPHDDPIVPNDLRQLIERAVRPLVAHVVVPRIEDRVLEDVHGFYRVVAGCGRLALSAPRQWADRSEREVSGVVLEVAAALGRPAAHGATALTPGAARLRADYFAAGRARREAFAAEHLPLARSAMPVLARRQGDRWLVPTGWLAEAATALDRVGALSAAQDAAPLGEMDGVLGAARVGLVVPGLGPDTPLSASALTLLWRCPFRFLLERLLWLREPAGRPSTDTIDPLAYGSLFHAAAEAFFREAGASVCEQRGSLPAWIERARAVAAAQFDRLCDEYPLRGADATARERARLLRQIEQLVRYEWESSPRAFIATEQSFGVPEPVLLPLPGGALYVRGTIDRVDRGGRGVSVRDLKTGRLRDFGEEPVGPVTDLQLGLYAMVLDAAEAGSVVHAAYVHPSAAQDPERKFEGDNVDKLRAHTRGWLETARGLLDAGVFPRTPNADDCRFCPFVPACGDGAQERSAAKLRAPALLPELAEFVRIKSAHSGDE